jgi:uncharacterized protein
MLHTIGEIIAKDLNISTPQVLNTLKLLEDGATVPFISRYRKEQTGSLDEVQVQNVSDSLKRYTELVKRKESILKSINEQGKLNEELKAKIDNCWNTLELEDLYLPFKQKRKTKASVAREKGLEPLAGSLMKQELQDLDTYAHRFIKGDVSSLEEALAGARDIIAEWVNERAYARNTLRRLYSRSATIQSKLVKGKEEEGQKYENYFKFSEPLKRCPSHRLLAIRRGEEEGILRVSIGVEEEEALMQLERIFIKSRNECAEQLKLAVKDGYKRLLSPSIETEFKNSSKEKADAEAIHVFAENLRQLLLTPPLGPKRTLAIDPGFRTGCKVVCLDEHGALLHNENIYPHPPQSESSKAAAKISNLVEAYKLQAIAIGNGTAGRETERFIQKYVRFKSDVAVYVVNEAGASIYSASKIARDEFPKYDVTVRGSVSIGRRLMDPLAELVKIDPKSIGVGQYQHDVDQGQLKNSLDKVVESTVNQVGANLNTASEHLLTYVSGLGPKLASNIIEHRNQNGAFSNRNELKKISGLGPKAFEQAAGFLRIREGQNPLDNSSVHPESYSIVQKMAKDLNIEVSKLIGNKELIAQIKPETYISETVGLPTLTDIISELTKAGRDPRGKTSVFSFDPNIRKMEDLKEGMILKGIVSNITKFGAFVDIGVKQDGLVHVSEMADRFISDPNEIVRLQEVISVKVTSVEIARKRIQLSIKQVQ